MKPAEAAPGSWRCQQSWAAVGFCTKQRETKTEHQHYATNIAACWCLTSDSLENTRYVRSPSMQGRLRARARCTFGRRTGPICSSETRATRCTMNGILLGEATPPKKRLMLWRHGAKQPALWLSVAAHGNIGVLGQEKNSLERQANKLQMLMVLVVL